MSRIKLWRMEITRFSVDGARLINWVAVANRLWQESREGNKQNERAGGQAGRQAGIRVEIELFPCQQHACMSASAVRSRYDDWHVQYVRYMSRMYSTVQLLQR